MNLSWTYFFLFIFKRNTWIPIYYEGYKKPTFLLRLVDGMRLFLKPYLIIGFIWYFIQVVVFWRFDYDPVQITLGHAQLLINFIDKLPFVNFLSHHDKTAFVIIGLSFLYIPFLYDYRVKLKTFKDYAGSFLVYLSIVSSISLFGASTGKVTSARHERLSKLDLTIHAIHDSIFLKLAEQIIEKNYLPEIVRSQDSIEKDIESFSKALNSDIDSSGHNLDSRQKLGDTLSEMITALTNQYTLKSAPPAPPFTDVEDLSTEELAFEFYVQDFGIHDSYNYGDYLGNVNDWKISDGKELWNIVKEETIKTPLNNKFRETIELLSEYLVGVGAEKVLSIVKLENLKFLGKFLELFSNNTFIKRVNEAMYTFLVQLGNPKMKIKFANTDYLSQRLYINSKPEPNNYEKDFSADKSRIRSDISGQNKRLYEFDLNDRINGYINDYDDPDLSSLQTNLINGLMQRSPSDLAKILKITNGSNNFPDFIGELEQSGFLTNKNLQEGKKVYYKSVIIAYLNLNSENLVEKNMPKKLKEMDISQLETLASLTKDLDYEQFVNKLYIMGYLSNIDLQKDLIDYYKYLIVSLLNSKSQKGTEYSQLESELKDKLINHSLKELKKIFGLADGTDNLYQWLLNLKNVSYLTESELKRFHCACPCASCSLPL
jgi:hypothetical protein